jgi:hypothetical protein
LTVIAIAASLLSLRGAAFGREELATWRDVAIYDCAAIHTPGDMRRVIR